MSKKWVDWLEIMRLVDITDMIKEEVFFYDLIIAVVRGGLVPATMLSHKLGITYFVAMPN